MRYGSVCSGIEAASVAWEALGWMPAWFSEIEAFPSAVLAHHWPHVANLGDMTKIAAAVRAGEVEAPSLLVGGTPCQAFSIAGLRNGLADERGQLTLSYVELANAIDEKRRERGEPESIIVWENVPGVLNSKDNAFGCFLAGLAGESSELQPAGGKWAHAGCVSGPERVIAWRVLDAQFFGVAQRRRRVFVVASARKGFDPAKILFELDSMRRDTPPSRGEGQEIAGTLKARAKSGGWSQDVDMAAGGYMQVVGSHWDNPENPHPTLNQSNNIGGIGQSNQEVFAQRGAGIVGAFRMTAFGEYTDDETASTVKARDYKDATDLAVTYSDVSRTLLAKSNDSMAEDLETYAIHGTQDPDINTDLAHTLGLNHGQENAVIAFSYKDNGTDATNELSPTLRAGNHDSSHANGGQPPAIAYAFAENSRGEVRMQDGDGKITGSLTTGGGKPGQGTPAVAIAGNIIGRTPGNGGNGTGYYEEVCYTLTKTDQHGVVHGMQVRRLTPAECERLQGFPDNHTMIPWRGKDAEDCPDGPRYKAIGNSMAVPVMHWIGKRIQQAVAEAEPLISLSPYSQNLNKLRSRPAHILKEIGDQWRTPDDLWWGMNAKFGPFVLDLFADDHNAKCEAFYTAEDNALTQDWSARLAELGGAAYANPPYSRAQQHNGQYITGMVHIMQHTMAMRELGGRYVYLIKAATSESWWPEDADHIAFIRGRIGFDVPDWFVPADEKQKPSGAFFAGAIAVFDKNWRGPATSYINREELEAMGRMFINQIQRAALRIQGVAA